MWFVRNPLFPKKRKRLPLVLGHMNELIITLDSTFPKKKKVKVSTIDKHKGVVSLLLGLTEPL